MSRTPLDFDVIRGASTGNWITRIYPAIGITFKNQNPKKHQPCPICGGDDRFRCDDKGGRGTWICNNCGAGDGFELVQKRLGSDTYGAFSAVAGALGIDGGSKVDEATRAKWRAEQAERETAERIAKETAQAQVAQTAYERFDSATECTAHPYLSKKGVQSHGLRVDNQGNLLIPLFFKGDICNLQTISQDSSKKLYIKDGRVKGATYTLGEILDDGVVFIAEGYATGASIFEALGGVYPVILTFDAGNMLACATDIRHDLPNHRLIFCADDDFATAQKTGKNTGIERAKQSASTTNSEYISPDFGNDVRVETGELTDYNDLDMVFGRNELKKQLLAALNRPLHKAPQDPIETPMSPTNSTPIEQILANFAQIIDIGKISNKIYDAKNCIELTKAQFAEQVGKELSALWQAHPDKKTITAKEVRGKIAEQLTSYSDLLDQYWYIQGTKEVFNFKTMQRQPIDTLKYEYPNEFDVWAKSDDRQKVPNSNIWFDPSETKRPANDEKYINTFQGMPLIPLTAEDFAGIEPTEYLLHTDILPIIELIRHLCGKDGTGEVVNWVLNWLAIPLQSPGTKMDTALIFHGHIQGAGKSLLFDRILREIYGDYALTLGQGQLESQYNDWVEGKLFTVFEEIISSKERYNSSGMIKQLITGDTVYINKKFMSGWKQDNFVNVVFLSNELQPFPIDSTDRRHIVLYPTAQIPENIKDELSRALADPNRRMIRAFYTYLLLKNTGNQTAHTPAIQTTAKTRVQRLSMLSWERFYTEWKEGDLAVPYQTCLSSDLYKHYAETWCKENSERATTATKFITFISTREDKRRVRYKLPKTHSNLDHAPQQGMVIYIETEGSTLTQEWYGQQIQGFRYKLTAITAQHKKDDDYNPFEPRQ